MAMPVLFALTFEILTTKYLVYFKNHFRIKQKFEFFFSIESTKNRKLLQIALEGVFYWCLKHDYCPPKGLHS